MNYASIKNCDIANGIGVRVSLFVSGCTHHCKNCFNKEAWDFNYGNVFTLNEQNKIIELLKPEYIAGLSLLGGEPMEPVNINELLPFVKKIKEVYPDKTIWCYSGYTFEQLLNRNDENTNEFLRMIDVLVDGKFIEKLKDLSLRFKGSSNQRIINVPESLKEKEIILWE